MHEIWKPIPGHEGYEASDLGHVRSWRHTGGVARRTTPKVLRPRADRDGYLRVCLGRAKTHHVHTLVARAFLGPRPEGREIDHVNGAKDDNRLANLEYVSGRENRSRYWRRRRLLAGAV